jgi:hypothetical protein
MAQEMLLSNLVTETGALGTAQKIGGSSGGGGGGSVTSVNGKTGAVVLTAADLDDSFKDALLDCFANVAWATDDGQQYYDALEAALYPVDHITAVYTQSGTVYDTDSLDSLKTDLVVTAFYVDGTSAAVAAAKYTLSGTLEAGTSTITVSYGGKTTTFDVTVTEHQKLPLATFVDGYAISKLASTKQCELNATSARMAMQIPIENKNYVFTSADTTKYQLAAYDITSLTPVSEGVYQGGAKTITWHDSDSVSTPGVWLAIKKLDNTNFTEEEVENAEGMVFTYTEE